MADTDLESAEDGSGLATDGTAVSIALDRARKRRKASGDNAADRLLAAQEALIADQRHHLREQLGHLRLKHWIDRVKFAAQLVTIAFGLAVLIAIAAIAWQAHQADGLVVESFSAPPSLIAQGVTGEVVARQVLDRLAQLDRDSHALVSVRVSDALTEHTKIEVPTTGVSLGELERLLRQWLGHETHLTGEVVTTASGLRLTVRTGAGETVTAEGPSDQLPRLSANAAEQVFAHARPNAYAQFLFTHGNRDGARALAFGVLAASDDLVERSVAYNLLGLIFMSEGRRPEADDLYRRAAQSPDKLLAAVAEQNIAVDARYLGHSRAARLGIQQSLALLAQAGRSTKVENQRRIEETFDRRIRYDYSGAIRALTPIVDRVLPGTSFTRWPIYAQLLAGRHEISESRRVSPGASSEREYAAGDWAQYLAQIEAVSAKPRVDAFETSPFGQAVWTIALARTGRLPEADTRAATLPADCTICLTARGVVASVAGDTAASDRWFTQASRLDPEEPLAQLTWGRERLARGQTDLAIANFKAAHAAAPLFADPLSGWGEALLAKGEAADAAAKFAQAARLAPRWGRLHLKWGEALAKLGKPADARTQFQAAAALDLTTAERAELAAQKV